jgi:hypothetical protein
MSSCAWPFVLRLKCSPSRCSINYIRMSSLNMHRISSRRNNKGLTYVLSSQSATVLGNTLHPILHPRCTCSCHARWQNDPSYPWAVCHPCECATTVCWLKVTVIHFIRIERCKQRVPLPRFKIYNPSSIGSSMVLGSPP